MWFLDFNRFQNGYVRIPVLFSGATHRVPSLDDTSSAVSLSSRPKIQDRARTRPQQTGPVNLFEAPQNHDAPNNFVLHIKTGLAISESKPVSKLLLYH